MRAKIIKTILYTTSFLLLITMAFALFVRSQTGTAWVLKQCQEFGADVKIDRSDAIFPLRWTLHGLAIKFDDGDTLYASRVHVRLSPLAFLHAALDITHIHIDELTYSYHSSGESSIEPITHTIDAKLGIGIYIRSLAVDVCTLNNLDLQQTLSLSLQGSFQKNKSASHLSCALKIYERDNVLKGMTCTIKKKHDFFYTSCHLYSDRIPQFFLEQPLPKDIDSKLSLEGPWPTHKEPLYLILEAKATQNTTPWQLHTTANLFIDGSMHISSLSLHNPFLNIEGEADLGKQAKIKNARITCHIENLSKINPTYTGSLDIQTTYSPHAWELTCESPSLGTNDHIVKHVLGTYTAKPQDGVWKGSFTASAIDQAIPLRLDSVLEFAPFTHLTFKELEFTAQNTLIQGSGTCWLNPLSVEGVIDLTTSDLDFLTRWFPKARGKGILKAHIEKSSQTIANASFQNIELYNLSAKQGELHISWPNGIISLKADTVTFGQAHLDHVTIDANSRSGILSFDGHAKGLWKTPFELNIAGSLAPHLNNIHIDLCNGFAFNSSYTLESPLDIYSSADFFTIPHSTIHIGQGTLTLETFLQAHASTFQIHAKHLPLNLFTALSSDISLYGSSSFDICLQEDTTHKTSGFFHLILEDADITHKGKGDPLHAKGSIQGHIHNENLQAYAHFQASNAQFLETSSTLPLSLHLFPFSFCLDKERPLSSEVTMEGRIEEIFDFVHMGSHHIQGLLSCRFFLSKTWETPVITGSLHLQEGVYENYFTGTDLKHIETTILAEKETLILSSLEAQDKKGGRLYATGKLLLNQREGCPFSIDANLNKLNCVHTDMVSADLSGPLHILGNKKSMQATGSLQVVHADCHIPDSLPSHIATIPVSYINMPETAASTTYTPPTLFPLYLDIYLQAPQGIFVRGRGLDAEWKGALHLTGTQTAIAATGACDLIKGEFLFSGKTFILNQGEITLSDKPTQSAFLSLSGTLTLPDQMTITAQLRGPLSSPQLTFQSMPHQPTSSILSHILFNKDISEITPFQAIQLAQAVVTLSGTAGPNVLEAIRKTLGVDKLNIVSSPGGADVSVQIGKYLTKGVMVSLTQSANSSNVTVEVELRPGLSFEAETQDQEEGKFSLKWHKRY